MDAICVERKEAEEEVKDRFRVLEAMDTYENDPEESLECTCIE